MNLDEHIQNKIRAISDDERLAQVLAKARALLEETGVRYAVIGSCGFQAYLECFYRLPNDLDLVVPAEESPRLLHAAEAHGWKYVQQLGRDKLRIDSFPVHLIPEQMAVIDKDMSMVFAKIDLLDEVHTARERPMHLIGARDAPSLRVASLESILFVELVRPIYTGSAMTIALALKGQQVDEDRIASLFSRNHDLRPIVLSRLERLPQAISNLAVLIGADPGELEARLCRLHGVLLDCG